MRKKGCGGMEKMWCEEFVGWVMRKKDVVMGWLMEGC